MNGFRPLSIFQETLLIVTEKDEELGFTLESEPNLVKKNILVKILFYQTSLVKNQ